MHLRIRDFLQNTWKFARKFENEEKGQNFQKIFSKTHKYLPGGLKRGKESKNCKNFLAEHFKPLPGSLKRSKISCGTHRNLLGVIARTIFVVQNTSLFARSETLREHIFSICLPLAAFVGYYLSNPHSKIECFRAFCYR